METIVEWYDKDGNLIDVDVPEPHEYEEGTEFHVIKKVIE